MLYHVTRNGQNYGPYTLEDLSRYVASGNVLLTDLAKSDEMTEWLPVSAILNVPGAGPGVAGNPPGYPPTNPPGNPAAYSGAPGTYDSPPNLSWGLVLLFAFFTCGLFMVIWNVILAAWANRIAPASKVLTLYIAVAVSWLILGLAEHHTQVTFGYGAHFDRHTNPLVSLLALGFWILRIYTRFTMRNVLEQHYNTVEPIGLRLSGVMTFFFGGIYFQYHLNRINDLKRAMMYRAPGV